MPYVLENMVPEDITEVAKVERLCFTMPWPTSAYRRELKTPESNRYIVERYIPLDLALRLGLTPPDETDVTSLHHPELRRPAQPSEQDERSANGAGSGVLSRWATLLPWVRNGSDQASHTPHDGEYTLSGYAGLWLMVDEAHVTTIGVHPDHRGHGAGELLFLGLTDIAHEMKATRLTLEVRVSNLSAQALYRKYGLEIAGVRRRYYSDNGEDAYIMWSEPLSSPEHRNRIAHLRTQLTRRLSAAFRSETEPSYSNDPTQLQ